jgi:hypothetical protein
MTDRCDVGSQEHTLHGQKSRRFLRAPLNRATANRLFRSTSILLVTVILSACGSRPTYRETELTIRGLGLYLAILDEFKREQAEKKPIDNRGQLDPIVPRFIPAGTSFQDAVAILRAVHFKVWQPRSFSIQSKDGEKKEHFVVESDLALVSTFLVGGTWACIFLDTDRPNPEPTTVKQASGFIQ